MATLCKATISTISSLLVYLSHLQPVLSQAISTWRYSTFQRVTQLWYMPSRSLDFTGPYWYLQYSLCASYITAMLRLCDTTPALSWLLAVVRGKCGVHGRARRRQITSISMRSMGQSSESHRTNFRWLHRVLHERCWQQAKASTRLTSTACSRRRRTQISSQRLARRCTRSKSATLRIPIPWRACKA